jgi:hypothetical protein
MRNARSESPPTDPESSGEAEIPNPDPEMKSKVNAVAKLKPNAQAEA